MFLQSIQSRGKQYIYLLTYENSQQRHQGKKIIYRFGRSNIAIEKMNQWQHDFKQFPDELKMLGCNQNDLEQWLSYVITKTGQNN